MSDTSHEREDCNVLNETYKECCLTVVAAIHAFLLENGGMRNGYETYVNGRARMDTVGCLDWSTRTVKELTGLEREAKGRELGAVIREILVEYGVEECIIRKIHKEWGCYETAVEFGFSTIVPLNFDNPRNAV